MDSVQFLKCISFLSLDRIIYWNKLYDLRNLVGLPVWFYWTSKCLTYCAISEYYSLMSRLSRGEEIGGRSSVFCVALSFSLGNVYVLACSHCSIFASLTYLHVYAVSWFALSRDPCLVLRYIGLELEMLVTLQCRLKDRSKLKITKKNIQRHLT